MQLSDLVMKGKDIKVVRWDGKKFSATVFDVNGNIITISDIVQSGEIVNLDENENINIIVNKDYDAYNLAVKVVGYFFDHGKRILKLSAYSSNVPKQKRDMFRLKIDGMTADIKAYSIYDVNKLQYDGPAEVVDLSETGMGIRIRKQLKQNGFVHCRFLLDGERLGFTGRVVYCMQARGRYAVGINFLDGSETERRSIRKYILCKQVRRED